MTDRILGNDETYDNLKDRQTECQEERYTEQKPWKQMKTER